MMQPDLSEDRHRNGTGGRWTRRGFLTGTLMSIGLAAGYGLGLVHFFKFLVPVGRKQKYREMYVGTVDALPPGASRLLKDPRGISFVLTRIGADPERDIIALSDTCPHLGCKVHWEGAKDRFLCPCHQGVFNRMGVATGGPPADMGEKGNLERYAVRVRGGNIFVMVKEESDVVIGSSR